MVPVRSIVHGVVPRGYSRDDSLGVFEVAVQNLSDEECICFDAFVVFLVVFLGLYVHGFGDPVRVFDFFSNRVSGTHMFVALGEVVYCQGVITSAYEFAVSVIILVLYPSVSDASCLPFK